jgi:hypothetical protein
MFLRTLDLDAGIYGSAPGKRPGSPLRSGIPVTAIIPLGGAKAELPVLSALVAQAPEAGTAVEL